MVKRRKKTISVDFEGVEAGRKLVPEGDYAIRIKEVTQDTGEDSGKDYLAWIFTVSRGPHKGISLKPYNTSLQPQALWNLRGVLEAFGVKVPDSTMEIDLEELNGIEEEAGCTVEHDTYQGRKQAQVVDIFDVENVGEGGETPSNDVTEEDIMSMSEDELSEFNDEHELEVDLDEHKKLKAKRKAIAEAWAEKSEGGEKGDDEELPDEDAINEADEEELEKVVEQFELDVDLDKLKNIKKKRAAVLEALEEKKESGEGEKITEEAIGEMSKDELKEFCEENDLDVELEGSTAKQRRAVIKAAKKAELIEEEEE